MKLERQRQYDLDFIRVLSIVAVIVIHGIAGAVLTQPINTPSWLIANILDSYSRWAVPVFLMLSGYLLIKPTPTLQMSEFLKKRFSHILIPLAVWPAVYTLWYAYMSKSAPDWHGLLFGYFDGTNIAPHLYFLFIIAGLYLIIPIINILRSAITNLQFLLLGISALVMTTLWYTAESYLPGHSISLNALTQFIPYIGYLMIGSSMKDFQFKRNAWPVSLFITLGAIMSLATYLTASRYGIAGKGLFFYSYFSLLTAALAPVAFMTLKALYKIIESKFTRDRKQQMQRFLQQLSNATFGVYLIHMIILMILPRYIRIDQTSIAGSLVFILLTLIASYALSLLLIKVPYVRRLIS